MDLASFLACVANLQTGQMAFIELHTAGAKKTHRNLPKLWHLLAAANHSSLRNLQSEAGFPLPRRGFARLLVGAAKGKTTCKARVSLRTIKPLIRERGRCSMRLRHLSTCLGVSTLK